jgi:murein DD-endopeptidase MepM/ murein hydrolase activator NlpD
MSFFISCVQLLQKMTRPCFLGIPAVLATALVVGTSSQFISGSPLAGQSAADVDHEHVHQGTGEIPHELAYTFSQRNHPLLSLPPNLELEPVLQEMIQQTAAREAANPRGVPVFEAGISAEFGMRRNPFGAGLHFHEGIDLVRSLGTPVYATADGMVNRAKSSRINGHYVVIDHGYGNKTLYAHLSRYTVAPNMKIKRGQLLGYIGSTGRSTGPHLHYGLYQHGKPVNPYAYMYDLQPTLADATYACGRFIPKNVGSDSVRLALSRNCAQPDIQSQFD